MKMSSVFEPLFRPKRIKVFFGGRGSGKSTAFAKALAAISAQEKKRVLCGREFQNSIDESVIEILSQEIEKLGLSGCFNVLNTEINGANGSEFRFKGLARNPHSIKSFEGIDIFWGEEANTFSQKSLDLLIPTVRKVGSELWFSFNPFAPTDPLYQMFVKPYLDEIKKHGFYENDYIYVAKVSWRDNPWFPDELMREMLELKARDYKKYLHVWEGELFEAYEDSVIEPEWFDAAIDAHLTLGVNIYGERCVGFDPADTGKDAKAITLRHGTLIEDVKTKDDGDIDDAITWAFSEAYEYNATDLVYDCIGNGAGVKVGLRSRLRNRLTHIHAFNAAERPDEEAELYQDERKNKDTFRNKRAQYWWLLRERFRKTYRAVTFKEYFDPSELIFINSEMKELDELKSELIKVQRKRIPGSQMIQIVSKEEMKRNDIPSPNRADSLVMSFAISSESFGEGDYPDDDLNTAEGWA